MGKGGSMYYSVISGAIWGMRPYILNVEADVCNGMPFFNMVGLLSSEVKEARERVRSAIRNSGFELRAQRITINLSPADKRKAGVLFDLPIAVAIMAATDVINPSRLADTIIVGELSLDGSIHKVNGVLPILIEAVSGGVKHCIIPYDNYNEATEAGDIHIIPVSNLKECVEYINCGTEYTYNNYRDEDIRNTMVEDFSEVKGHNLIRRAAEIAVAGRHNMLMIGPPGAGKSMIAKRIAGIMPDLSKAEKMEIARIYSICGQLDGSVDKIKRPYRAPHHTITVQAMAGGGRYPVPGELTMAHKGVLFLDELPEFNPLVIDSLRQPMEEGTITISRATGSYEFAADTMVVAAMNPCKCGYYPDRSRCSCSEEEVKRYIKRISGAILDRMDICVEVPAVTYNELIECKEGECSKDIKQRVTNAADIQKERYKYEVFKDNAAITSKKIPVYCGLDSESRDIMETAFEKYRFSTRNYYKVLRIARTIADLDGSESVKQKHLIEALGLSIVCKKYWK